MDCQKCQTATATPAEPGGFPSLANGEIWSATLWDIFKQLGRDKADRIIIESHFQLDGFGSFAKAGRAIVEADRNAPVSGLK